MSRLAAIRARLAAATIGPWSTMAEDSKTAEVWSGDILIASYVKHEDAELFVRAPADLEYLLSVIDAARITEEELRAEIRALDRRLEDFT